MSMRNFLLVLPWLCIGLPIVASGDSDRTHAEDCPGQEDSSHCLETTGNELPGKTTVSSDTLTSEDDYNTLFCASVGGKTETRHGFEYPTGRSFVRIDCETEEHVYEGGLDKRSSLDSVQQALFFGFLTGKTPAVVIYDRDGKVGRFEYRIKMACERAGVQYISFP